MLTHNEVCQLIEENYTAEEIVEMLDISPRDLIRRFPCKVEGRHDTLVKQIQEDTGYGTTSDEG